MKVNCTKDRKIRANEKAFSYLEKNGGHRPSDLGGRSAVVVGQADETLAVYYFCKIKQIQFWSIFRLKPGRCQT